MSRTKLADLTADGEINGFDAIRGIQAGQEFYIVMCKLKLLPRLFGVIDYDVSPELRAQRVLQESRIPVLRDYILDNPDSYIFSSLTASVDGAMRFIPSPHLGPDGKLGRLYTSMESTFLINDGQHRLKAIGEAIKLNPKLGHESISVVFFQDLGLEKSQQMFSDLNKNALKPTSSLNLLYDHRDTFAQFVVKMVKDLELFRERVDLENTAISKRSYKIFTLNGITSATMKLFGHKKLKTVTIDQKQRARDFWDAVGKNIPQWQLLIKGKMTPFDLKTSYVHGSANLLNSLGIVGRILLEDYPDTWKKKLSRLRDVDWKRDNPEWEGRLLQGGRMVNTTIGIEMAANVLLKKCGIKLSEHRREFENKK